MEYEAQHRNVDHSNVGMLGPPAHQPVSTVGTGYNGHKYRVTKLIDVNIRENTSKSCSLKYFNRQGTPLHISPYRSVRLACVRRGGIYDSVIRVSKIAAEIFSTFHRLRLRCDPVSHWLGCLLIYTALVEVR